MCPKKEAGKILEEMGIDELPIDPVKIIDSLDIKRMDHDFNSIEGFSFFDPKNKKFHIGVNSQITNLQRKKFTYAHELGHVCLDGGNLNSCQQSDINCFKRLDPSEINANTFASHLLLPESLIKDKIKGIEPSWDEISKLSKITQTSLITAATRFIELTDHICLLAVIGENKCIKYFKKSQSWFLHFDMNSRIIATESCTHKSFLRKESSDFTNIQANLWIDDKRVSPDAQLLEWSLPINSYREVLTLLWDDEGLLESNEYENNQIFHDNTNKIGGVWSPPTFHKSKRK